MPQSGFNELVTLHCSYMTCRITHLGLAETVNPQMM